MYWRPKRAIFQFFLPPGKLIELFFFLVPIRKKKIILPPRQIKSTVRLCQRIKNRRRQIQTFDQNNN